MRADVSVLPRVVFRDGRSAPGESIVVNGRTLIADDIHRTSANVPRMWRRSFPRIGVAGLLLCAISGSSAAEPPLAPGTATFRQSRNRAVVTNRATEKGRPITGRVLDEKGHPVDGASVLAIRRNSAPSARQNAPPYRNDVAIRTVKGAFHLDDVSSSTEYLKISHGDFAPAYVEAASLVKRQTPSVTIVLKRGATVHGHVYDIEGRPEPDVNLVVESHDPVTTATTGKGARVAVARTDRNGAYEIDHLPDIVCLVTRAKPTGSPGEDRQAILLESGQKATLDFGGQPTIAGQLIVNGTPPDGAWLVFRSGVFRAFTRTSADGSFVFRGIPPGRRTLFYLSGDERTESVRVGTFTASSVSDSPGRIDLHVGRVTVKLERPRSILPEEAFVGLTAVDADPMGEFSDTGRRVRRTGRDDPYIFENVPAGRYRINALYCQDRHRTEDVEVTPENPAPTVVVRLTTGSARVRALADPLDPGNRSLSFLQIRSADGRFQAAMRGGTSEATYECGNLAPGPYEIEGQSRGGARVLARFVLADAQTKEIDLDLHSFREMEAPLAYRRIYVVDPEGRIIPGCDVALDGNGTTCKPVSVWDGGAIIAVPAGTYRLSVSFPGFEPHQEEIELTQPTTQDGTGTDRSLRVTLQPRAPRAAE